MEQNVGVRYHDTLLLSHLYLFPQWSGRRGSVFEAVPIHSATFDKPRLIPDFAEDFSCDIDVLKIGQFRAQCRPLQKVRPFLEVPIFLRWLAVILAPGLVLWWMLLVL